MDLVKLKIYETLNNLYLQRENIIFAESKYSTIPVKVQADSKFGEGNDFKLPLQITGTLITAGEYTDKRFGKVVIAPSDLKPTTASWQGVKIYTDHGVFQAINTNENQSVRDVIGQITVTTWNESLNAIEFTAEILDEDIARKIHAGLIDAISVGFGRTPKVVPGKAFLRDIRPKEASLVFNPRDKNARFRPVA